MKFNASDNILTFIRGAFDEWYFDAPSFTEIKSIRKEVKTRCDDVCTPTKGTHILDPKCNLCLFVICQVTVDLSLVYMVTFVT